MVGIKRHINMVCNATSSRNTRPFPNLSRMANTAMRQRNMDISEYQSVTSERTKLTAKEKMKKLLLTEDI
jgi:hypothetical protein